MATLKNIFILDHRSEADAKFLSLIFFVLWHLSEHVRDESLLKRHKTASFLYKVVKKKS